jgi:hypothetical protein
MSAPDTYPTDDFFAPTRRVKRMISSLIILEIEYRSNTSTGPGNEICPVGQIVLTNAIG